MKPIFNIFLVSAILITACSAPSEKEASTETETLTAAAADSLIYPNEKHFKNMRQLTFGGDNAEAYWSSDDTKLVMQSSNAGWPATC